MFTRALGLVILEWVMMVLVEVKDFHWKINIFSNIFVSFVTKFLFLVMSLFFFKQFTFSFIEI